MPSSFFFPALVLQLRLLPGPSLVLLRRVRGRLQPPEEVPVQRRQEGVGEGQGEAGAHCGVGRRGGGAGVVAVLFALEAACRLLGVRMRKKVVCARWFQSAVKLGAYGASEVCDVALVK